MPIMQRKSQSSTHFSLCIGTFQETFHYKRCNVFEAELLSAFHIHHILCRVLIFVGQNLLVKYACREVDWFVIHEAGNRYCHLNLARVCFPALRTAIIKRVSFFWRYSRNGEGELCSILHGYQKHKLLCTLALSSNLAGSHRYIRKKHQSVMDTMCQ